MSENPFRVSESSRRKENHTSKERIVAVSADGRKNAVQLEGEENDLIGHGRYGSIRRVQAEAILPRKIPIRWRERVRPIGSMAVKEYDEMRVSEDHIQQSLHVHGHLRRLGIATWNTLRRIDGRDAILMTDGEGDGAMTVAYNPSKSRNLLFEQPFGSFENFENALEKALGDIAIASKHGVYLHGDAWFVNLRGLSDGEEMGMNRTGMIERFYVGDFDKVKIGIERGPTLEKENLKQFIEFVDDVLLSVCLGKSREIYRKALADIASRQFPIFESSRNEKGMWRVESRE